jgi:DNA-binding NtrC family response regulator
MANQTPPAIVLIIDDEPMIRWAMEETLRTAGYDVAVAATAAEGLAQFSARRPRVVFLDLRLPDEDGFAVLKKIKAECGNAVAVIVMTAFSELCSAAEAQRLGAYGYLTKPFPFEALEELVAQALTDTRRCTP